MNVTTTLDVSQTAQVLDLPESTVVDWVRSGILRVYQLPGGEEESVRPAIARVHRDRSVDAGSFDPDLFYLRDRRDLYPVVEIQGAPSRVRRHEGVTA